MGLGMFLVAASALAGQERVFAVGDVTAVPELKMARAAGEHAEVVAGNIRALIGGGSAAHEDRAVPDAMLLNLGPAGAEAPAGEAWIYVTGAVVVTRTPVEAIRVLGAGEGINTGTRAVTATAPIGLARSPPCTPTTRRWARSPTP